MAVPLHKKYRITTTGDGRNLVLQTWSQGMNRRTGEIGQGRWVDESYHGRMHQLLEKYVNDRIVDKVGGERTLVEPKEILEEYKNIKQELEQVFNIPVDKIIDDLKPEETIKKK
jgi:hypothetical protein